METLIATCQISIIILILHAIKRQESIHSGSQSYILKSLDTTAINCKINSNYKVFHYDRVNFAQDTHKRHHIACQTGVCVWCLANIFCFSLLCFLQYLVLSMEPTTVNCTALFWCTTLNNMSTCINIVYQPKTIIIFNQNVIDFSYFRCWREVSITIAEG